MLFFNRVIEETAFAHKKYDCTYFIFSEEADELEHLVTSQTESVSYDHPNHTVTVTTISDLDLSGARVLGLTEVIYLSFINLFINLLI